MEILAGRKRTFMLKLPGGRGGIYQRTGTGRRSASDIGSRNVKDMNLRTLYRFAPSAKIDSRLEFVSKAEMVFQNTFDRHFTEAFDRSIGISKARSLGHAERVFPTRTLASP